MPDVNVSYTPPKTLYRFMFESKAFVRCVVGPLGSGKSSACVMEILRRAVEQKPGPDGVRRTRFVVIRNTRPQLQDTTRKTFEVWIPQELGKWNESEFTFTMKFDDVHCEVLFRALDRPKDVRKVLSLEVTGAYINEAREIPKEVFDGLQGRVGRYPSMAQGGATWFGIWMDTNPWHTGHWGYKLFSKGRPKGFELFEQPDALGPDGENKENLIDAYYERLTEGKDQEWIDEYVRGKYPNSDRGSVYGQLITSIEAKGSICEFPHNHDGVFCNFDLGISDSTAIFWWRFNEHRAVDIIDWYECHGMPASHYFKVLETRGYKYAKIFLPHDARSRTFQTGVSTLDLFRERFPGLVAICSELSIEDGIAAGRWLLEQKIRIHSRCEKGVERIRSYKYEWDDDKKIFGKKPMHDWTSHTADAFRYVAATVKTSEIITRPAETGHKRPAAVPMDNSFVLDELWEAHGR